MDFKKNAKKQVKEAEKKKWNVVCVDESRFILDTITRRRWAKKGSNPIVLTTGSHSKTCLFGAVSLDGKQLFRQYEKINGENFLRYLKLLKRKYRRFLFSLTNISLIRLGG
jgi:hypothetical protein